MAAIFLLQALISFFIFLFFVYVFFKYYSNIAVNRATNILSSLMFGYFLIFLISLFWYFGYSEYNSDDFLLLYGIVIVSQTLILFFSFKSFANSYKFFYLLLMYVVVSFAFLISFQYVISLFIIMSFFITLILFLFFFSKLNVKSRTLGYLGIIYSLYALIIFFISLVKSDIYYLTFPLHIIFFIFVLLFFRNIYSFKFTAKRDKKYFDGYLQHFIKYFVYVLVFISLTLISTIVVHEFGHVLSAKFFECSYETIFFKEDSYPYTEILCSDGSLKNYALLAGPILPIILALLILLLSGGILKELTLLVIGFDIIISFRDISEFGLSTTLILSFQVIGFIFLALGVILLSKYKFEEVLHLKNIRTNKNYFGE